GANPGSALAIDPRLRAAAREAYVDGVAGRERVGVDDDGAVAALDDAVAALEDARGIEVREARREPRAARRRALDGRVRRPLQAQQKLGPARAEAGHVREPRPAALRELLEPPASVVERAAGGRAQARHEMREHLGPRAQRRLGMAQPPGEEVQPLGAIAEPALEARGEACRERRHGGDEL